MAGGYSRVLPDRDFIAGWRAKRNGRSGWSSWNQIVEAAQGPGVAFAGLGLVEIDFPEAVGRKPAFAPLGSVRWRRVVDFPQQDSASVAAVPSLGGDDVADGVDFPADRELLEILGAGWRENIIDADDVSSGFKHGLGFRF